MITNRSPRSRTPLRFAALTLVAGLAFAACGDDKEAAPATTMATPASTASTMTPASSGTNMAMMGAFGTGCAAVPAEGAGSFAGMAESPAATAASANPVLSTLVAAVTAAELVDTLNGPGPFTIFAPSNDAFAKIPAKDLDAVLANKEQLTSILTVHVIAGKKLSVDELVAAGSEATVNGQKLSFSKNADGSLEIDGEAAGICMNVPTANATVHIIDTVLMPMG